MADETIGRNMNIEVGDKVEFFDTLCTVTHVFDNNLFILPDTLPAYECSVLQQPKFHGSYINVLIERFSDPSFITFIKLIKESLNDLQ